MQWQTFAMLLFTSGVQAQSLPELDNIARAMGGKDRVLGVRTLLIEGRGDLLYFGQTYTPYANTSFAVTKLTRAYDFANRRWRFEQTREARYLNPMPPAQRIRTGLDGVVGYNVIGDAVMSSVPTSTSVTRLDEFVYHPIGFLQAAYRVGNTVKYDGRARRVELRVDDRTYTMQVNARTHLPTRISRVVDHPMLGDVELETEFIEWAPMAGLTLPTRIVQRQLRWTLSDYRITSAQTNVDLGNLSATDSVRTVAAALTASPPPRFSVTVDSVAPGVWILDSGLYHTIAVEQSDKVVLIEAPESDGRTLAAIAKAREKWPNKSLGPLVNSHHHFDHAGGVRAAISEGLSIITHEGNRDFIETFVYARPHRINPDALARNQRALSLVSVRDKLVMNDPVRPVEVYEATGTTHSGSALLVYVPAARVLIQGDLEMPELVANVRRLGLDVDVLIGLHDRPARWPKA